MGSVILVLAIVYTVTLSIYSKPVENYKARVKRGTPAADWEVKRWPNATVYYRIDEKLESIKDDLLRALKYIENISCIRYIPRTNQIDYVVFENNLTCKEPVGRQGGEQKILISIPECGNFGFFLHAAMQVLGFYHEHQRFDRDNYVTVYQENIDPEWLDWSFRKLNTSSHFDNSTYDVNSIMHYGSYQYSINGKPTILTKSGSELRPWTDKSDLTDLDKQAINDYYACSKNNGHTFFSRLNPSVLFLLFLLYFVFISKWYSVWNLEPSISKTLRLKRAKEQANFCNFFATANNACLIEAKMKTF